MPLEKNNPWKAPVLPVNADSQQLGLWGEDLAVCHLQAAGVQILARNWRCRFGELDIVGLDPQRNALIAYEVKTRRQGSRVAAIEAVSTAKLGRLRVLLSQWLAETSHHTPAVGIDLIAITLAPDSHWNLHHIEDLV